MDLKKAGSGLEFRDWGVGFSALPLALGPVVVSVRDAQVCK